MLTYEQSVQSAIEEVRDQLVAFAAEHRRRDSLAKAVDANRESVDLANQLYTQGLTDFLSVLDAQRQLYQAQDDLAQSDAQLDSSLIALYKALGGGWENAIPESPSAAPAPRLLRHRPRPRALKPGAKAMTRSPHDTPGAPAPAPSPPTVAPPPRPRKRWIALSVLGILFLGGAIAGTLYWLHARQFESTDDAFVDGNVVAISPQVAGRIKAVHILDNQDRQCGRSARRN